MPIEDRATPISAEDYLRAFQVAHSVASTSTRNVAKACAIFALAGVEILKVHYGLDARRIAGAAFYHLHDRTGLGLGRIEGSAVSSSESAFHCWILCEDVVIDLVAPIFREMLADAGHRSSVPRKMFQRHIDTMAPSIDDVTSEGDFHYAPNPELTAALSAREKPASGDLASICAHWFVRAPQPLMPSLTMQDDRGELTEIHLSRISTTGRW